jgi:hypothetical protein
MQKTADYLRTKGVDIVWGPRVRERAEICDPNGYHIELKAVVPVSGCVHDRRAAEGASKIIYRGPPTSTKTAAGGLVGWHS